MKVYKFGGASVKDAAGVRTVCQIVGATEGKLLIVVSAMGKTTNALEEVVSFVYNHQKTEALQALDAIRKYHYGIIEDLFPTGHIFLQNKIEQILQLATDIINSDINHISEDELYDQIVSIGELISTRIVTYALDRGGVENTYLLMPTLLRTDNTYREAKIDIEVSEKLLRTMLRQVDKRVCVAQGFIGGTADGKRTTLGREGSDYTAAVLANILQAESVTIWKDVPGILNADPRIVKDIVLIPELSYYEAVELAYSGAQVIHPKTIRPLENKHIPLYVRPFSNPQAPGSIITNTDKKIDVPVLIWRKNQILITIRPDNFSFVLEECLNQVFEIIHRYRLKVSLIQSSAVTISISVDNCNRVMPAIKELQQAYRVSYNTDLELLTIRGSEENIISGQIADRKILLEQRTRRTARFLMEKEE